MGYFGVKLPGCGLYSEEILYEFVFPGFRRRGHWVQQQWWQCNSVGLWRGLNIKMPPVLFFYIFLTMLLAASNTNWSSTEWGARRRRRRRGGAGFYVWDVLDHGP